MSACNRENLLISTLKRPQNLCIRKQSSVPLHGLYAMRDLVVLVQWESALPFSRSRTQLQRSGNRGAAAWRPGRSSVVQDSDRQDSSTAPGKGGDNREPQVVVPASPRRSESERVNRATLNGHLDSHELVVHATCNGTIGQCKLLAQGFLISATAVRELLGLRVTTLCVLTSTRGSQRSCRHERVGACALRVVVCARGLHRVVTLAHVAAPDQQR